ACPYGSREDTHQRVPTGRARTRISVSLRVARGHAAACPYGSREDTHQRVSTGYSLSSRQPLGSLTLQPSALLKCFTACSHTITRAYHFLFAGTTTQGACLVSVFSSMSLVAFSYSFHLS